MTGILDGVRVIDFGRYIAGPYCACLLGDMGAEVIRMERVGGGEDRAVTPLAPDDAGAMFLQLNRNKKSVTLDPTTPEGREVVRRLVATADIVVANLPPQALKPMGLDYDTLRAIRPDIILTSISAFGPKGPWSDRVAFDGVAQVMSGLTYMSGVTEDAPQKFFGPWVDFASATYAAFGTLGALMWRRQTGQGQHVDGSMLMAAMIPAGGLLAEQAVTRIGRKPSGNRSQNGAPADLFRTRDGWIIAQVVSDALYKRWARLMGDEFLLTDPRFRNDASRVEHNAVLNDRMTAWCAERTSAEALELLGKSSLPAGPVLTPQEVLDHEHVHGMGALQNVDYPGIPGPTPLLATPINLSATPGTIRTRPPLSGEHTDEILAELGYSSGDIASLRTAAIV